mgnify:CR=1 FL=1
MSNVVIVGAGNVGGPLAQASTRAGHNVTTLTRTSSADASVEALKGADLVVLAVPYTAALQLPEDWTTALEGKVVVDATNPLADDFSALTVGFETSAGEEIGKCLPKSRVVKALNAVLAPNHDPESFPAGSVFVPVAGDEETAVAETIAYLRSLGFAPEPAGPLKNARYIEPLAELLVQLAYFQGIGTAISVSLQRG